MNTYHCLGRPLPRISALLPPELDAAADVLVGRVRGRLPGGGVIRVGGDCCCESAVYQILAMARSRLLRQGCRVSVSGEIFCDVEAPPVPDADAAILLDAPAYVDSGEWSSPARGCVTLLAGWLGDWKEPPDMVCARPSAAEIFFDSTQRLMENWDASAPDIRELLYIAALGVDLPESMFAESLPSVLTSVMSCSNTTTRWFSVEGQWLAWECLKSRAEMNPRRLQDRLPPGYPGRIRLSRRFEMRTCPGYCS